MIRPLYVAVALLGLSACAAPPLKLYTLGYASDGAVMTPPRGAPSLQIAQVMLPDYLDTQDMVVRDDAVIHRSASGRWAERLSVGIGELVTSGLQARYPGIDIASQRLPVPADARLDINVERFDVTQDGRALLDATWSFAPMDPKQPIVRKRVHIEEHGSVGTDAGLAALMRRAVQDLGGQIALPSAALTAR